MCSLQLASGLLLLVASAFLRPALAVLSVRKESHVLSTPDGLSCKAFQNGNIEQIKQRASSGPVYAEKDKAESLVGVRDGKDYVFLIGLPFTGTTALLSLLSTSPEVANLCADKRTTFTCEGTWPLILEKIIPDQDSRWKADCPADWNRALELYSDVWNMSKQVLVDKSPPSSVKMPRIAEDLARTGKRAFFIVLSHSPCYLDEIYRDEEQRGHATQMAEDFLKIPSSQMLHIQYEQLISDPYGTSSLILEFLPRLKHLDPTINGLNTAQRIANIEEVIKDDPRHVGKDESLVGYVKTKYPFEFPQATLDPAWSHYMQTFGY